MKTIKKYVFNNQLLSGSLVIIIGSLLANFGSFLYHFLMGRMLGPADYGTLSSLIAILYILTIPSLALTTVIVKFTTVYKARGDYERLYSLLLSFTKKTIVVGAIVILFFILARNWIVNFLQIQDIVAVILAGSALLTSLLMTINSGILQGLLKFNFLAANGVFGALLKLGLGVLLVWAGFSVVGAILAIIISTIIPYFVSFYPLRLLWRHKSTTIEIDHKEIFGYAGPTMIAALGMTSLYSTDIILVKHFFPAFEAGLYGGLSTLGKIIFFASSAIGIVMFPIISERFEKGTRYLSVLHQAFALVMVSSMFLTVIYFIWPKFMISLLYGSSYLQGASYLGVFAIFISVYCLSNLMLQFFLSIRKTNVAFLSLGAAIFQVILIWLFHKNFLQVIYSSTVATSLLLLSLLIYYLVNIHRIHHEETS